MPSCPVINTHQHSTGKLPVPGNARALCAKDTNTHQPDSAWLLPGLLENLQHRATETVCRYQSVDISGGMLLDKVMRLTAALQNQGLTNTARVGVALGRSPDMLVVMLALWQVGAVYVPLDSTMPRERLLAQQQAAGLSHLIVLPARQALFDLLPVNHISLVPIDYQTSTGEVQALQTPLPEPGASSPIAYILFTSGSTGVPKAVAISHSNLATLFNGIITALRLPAQLRLLGCANPAFDIAMFEWLFPLLANGCLVLADDGQCGDPEQLNKLMHSESVTAVQATPSLWRLLLHQAGGSSLPMLEVAISTGEALPRTLASELMAHSKVLWNLYGPTECTVWTTAHQVQQIDLDDNAPPLIAIGTALPGYMVALEAETDTNPETGELLIEGAAVASGYLCATPEQQACFRPPSNKHLHWLYKSGDRCTRDARGSLHFVGRLDSQVKCNGYRIDLEEIAGYLRQHNSIVDACCLVATSANSGDQLLAFMVWQRGQPNKNRQQLRAHLARWLPDWMLPQRYIPVSNWPLGANGKLDRQALLVLTEPILPAHKPQPGQTMLAAVPESASVTGTLASIFCELLTLDTVSPGDSFFGLGGNSMLVATLLMVINDRFHTRLSLRELLSTPPTISQLSRMVLNAGISSQELVCRHEAPGKQALAQEI